MPERTRLRTGDQTLVREINLSLIMAHLRDHAPVSRAELAEMTGLNKSTVSSLVQTLIDEQFVYEVGRGSNQVGRPSTLLKLNPEAGYIVSAEIGVDFVSTVCANFAAEVIWQHRQSTYPDQTPETILDITLDLLRQAADAGRTVSPERSAPLGIALGIPGLVDQSTGMLLFAPNLKWQDVPLRQTVNDVFPNVPTFVDNEANLAALGEHFYGAARGHNPVLYISVGVGLGGAIVVDSHLFKGRLGFASEFGHMTFAPDGELCNCGNRGCWETVVSQSALFRAIRLAVASGQHSVLCDWLNHDLTQLNISQVVQAARAGDAVALGAMNNTGHALGIGIASLVNALNPDLVVFGGVLSTAGELLLPIIREELQRRALRWNAQATKIVLARHGVDACVMGGIAVVYQHILLDPLAVRAQPKGELPGT